jgi:hypothetical protein
MCRLARCCAPSPKPRPPFKEGPTEAGPSLGYAEERVPSAATQFGDAGCGFRDHEQNLKLWLLGNKRDAMEKKMRQLKRSFEPGPPFWLSNEPNRNPLRPTESQGNRLFQ